MTMEEMKKKYEHIASLNKNLFDKIEKKVSETEHYTWHEFKDLTEMLKNIVKVDKFICELHKTEEKSEKTF